MSTYQPERFPFPSPRRLRRELLLPTPPRWLLLCVLALLLPAAATLALIYRARHSISDKPRIHLIQDMAVQPRYAPQAAADIFADGRAMRLPVPGTIARGALENSPHYHHGFEMRPDEKTGQPAIFYFQGLPPQVQPNAAFLDRGRTVFNIYCAVCHGESGDGHGPVNDRAVSNKEPKWVPATSLLSDQIRQRRDGYLYNVVRHGIRNMPAYGLQIQTYDRWAAVAHVRQLQQQRPADTQPARP